MDWKRFYAEELADPSGRAAVLDAVARNARGDETIQLTLRAGGVASFPHVSIHESAEPIARVAQTVLEMNAKRVVALGVLHGGTLPPACRDAHASLQGAPPQAEEAFRQLGGAFVARGAVPTPFGSVDEGPAPACSDFVRQDAEILDGEFSLDLFLALLAAAALSRGVRAPPVTRVFVSATRSPDGSFRTAAILAAALGALRDADTVCVATGDLVHVGNAYTAAAELVSVPTDAQALQAALLPQIAAMHDAALQRRDFCAAWAIGTRLQSDQRHLLPVISELVGPNATARLLSFRLADYSHINGVPPPCLVGAGLGVFQPAGLHATASRQGGPASPGSSGLRAC